MLGGLVLDAFRAYPLLGLAVGAKEGEQSTKVFAGDSNTHSIVRTIEYSQSVGGSGGDDASVVLYGQDGVLARVSVSIPGFIGTLDLDKDGKWEVLSASRSKRASWVKIQTVSAAGLVDAKMDARAVLILGGLWLLAHSWEALALAAGLMLLGFRAHFTRRGT